MKKLLFILAFICTGLTLFAQEHSHTFTLYFDTDSSALTAASRASLDSVKNLVKDLDEYQIELSGHTDQQGSIWYNQRLSERREVAAFTGLTELGLNAERIRTAHFGEQKLAERIAGQEDIAANRRVEVKVSYLQFSSTEELLRYTRMQSEQVTQLNDNGAQEITGEKGTQLMIPNDAFQTKDGRPVDNSKVTFVLEEFPGMGSAVSHGLSTLSDGKILESGGMFRMEAIAGEDTLVLRDGKRIDVLMPSKNLQKGMSVFVGERNAQGDVIWQDTKQSFAAVDTTPTPKMPLPGMSNKLLAMQVDLPVNTKYRSFQFEYARPMQPIKPHAPRKPKEPKEPLKPDGEEPGWTYIFNSTWKNFYKAQHRYEEKMATYNQRYEGYLTRQAEYEAKMKQWPLDSVKYVSDMADWKLYVESQIEERVALLDSVSSFYDALRFNAALRSIAGKMNDSVFYRANLLQYFQKGSGVDLDIDAKNAREWVLQEIMFLELIKSGNEIEHKKQIYSKGQPDIYKFRRQLARGKFTGYMRGYNAYRGNQVYTAFTMDETKTATLIELGKDIAAQKRALGIFDRTSISEVYSASLGNMGFINCDRFADVPPNMMAQLDVKSNPNSKLYVVVHDLNSVIPLYSGHDSTAAAALPVGKEVTILSIGTHEGKPTLAMEHAVIKQDHPRIVLQPRMVTLETLNKVVAKL